jgi:amino acid adenylation domain-containing protein
MQFDVVVHAIDDGQAMHIHLSYWSDKVSSNRANAMAQSFSSILLQILQRPDILPVELHMASDEDLRQLWSWNAVLPPVSDQRIEQMITQQVMENPDRDALYSTKETLSYQELDTLSTELSQSHLANVTPEEIIPLCFEKSVWVAVAMVAVLKAGATVVLVDPSHPVERLKSIVGTVKANLILASPSQLDVCINSLGVHTVAVSRETFDHQSSRSSGASTKSITSKRRTKFCTDAAYVVFTSGSTGTPKGSVTEHRSFCTATKGYHKAIGQLPGTRVLQFASYSFDASILEILGSLMVGATVCIPTDKERSNQLTAFINKSRVSFAVITPTVASLFEPEDVPTLSCLALCGESMTASHVSKWADKVRLVNAFGPSECCVGSAANQQLTKKSDPKCIGWAVSCCYWVVHPRNHNRLARVGSVGELLIEGSILSRHYLNEEAKTKEAFIDAPEWAKPGRATRLYKTGDLVFQNADGSFQYVGRKDSQAKIRGQRLELGDIEHAFKEVVPQSDSIVAEVVKAEGRPSQLVVFFSSKNLEVADIDTINIQSRMSQKIPSYMVPSAIILLPEMPLMPSGKADRKKIRSMGAARPVRKEQRTGRSPETEMEIALAAVWKDVMKGDKQILADDSFFQVGGDSYTAMKLVTEARARGISLNVSIVMQTPKLAEMALKATRSINNKQANLGSQTTPAFSMVQWTPAVEAEVSKQCGVATDKIEDVYPCTPLQEGLFVLSIKQPGSYVARHCYRISPALDLCRYKDAWSTVFERSTILRTHIVQLDNAGGSSGRKSSLYQVVVKKPLAWEHHAGPLDKCLSAQAIPSLGAAITQYTIVEEKSGSRYLVLTMHHAAYDGASVGMLLNSVEAVYTGTQRPASIPFREFIKYLEGSKGEPTRNFWTQYLDGTRASNFPRVPVGYVPSADSTFEQDLTVPVLQTKAYTVSTMIRVAWAIVMARYMGAEDVVFGETLSGRNDSRDGIADVDGPLITTVPMRCTFNADSDIADVLSTMQRAAVDMIPFQQAGLQNIRFMSPDAAEACKFSSLVTIAPASEAQAKPSLGITPVGAPPSPAMDYPISIQFILNDHKRLTVSVCHDNGLIDGIRMRGVVDQFGHVLKQLSSGEKKRIREIEVEVESTIGEVGTHTDVLGVLGGAMVDIPEEISSQALSNVEPTAKVVRAAVTLEMEMRNLWADIIQIDAQDVAPEDNFFRLGGDSISAMRLVTAAEHKQIKITVADIFHHPTLAELCEFAAQANVAAAEDTTATETAIQEYTPFTVLKTLCLEREDVVDAVCSQLSVFPGDVEDVYPATDYQAWAVSHGLMRSRGNTNYFLFRLHGDLDTFLLEQACRKMVASNPILRTLFTTIGSQVMQVVLRSYQIEFQRYGREHRADDDFIRWLVEQDTQRSTYLSQSIVRFKLLKHTEGHYVLVMRVSHAQYDGMSLPLLYRDLEKCYGGHEPIARPSFGSFIQAATVKREEAVNFWSELLDGSSMTEVVQHPGPAYKHNVDTIRTRSIPPIPSNVAGMSQATLVKAAWALVLAKMSGQRDIVFGNLVFGRNIPVSGIEDISGPCINMIPIRVRLNEMDRVQDLLALVQEQQLAAMPHESLGFRRLIKNCTDWPTWTRFSSVVQHQNLGRNGAQEFHMGKDLKCEMGVLGPAYDSSDLWVQTTPQADSFKVEIGSCSAVVSPDIAEILLDRLCSVLTVFASVGSGGDCQLWELLARDHAPLIPIKSSVVDQVWSRVLPDASAIPWDTPYFELWGDEIAPVRFLEEFAEHGVLLDMEDILEHPTKQAQMMLTARVLAEKDRAGITPTSRRRSGAAAVTTAERGGSGGGGTTGAKAGAAHGVGARSFWVLDSKVTPPSQGSNSRGSSVLSSPRFGSPRVGATLPSRGKGPGKGVRNSTAGRTVGSRSGSCWDLPSPASWSDNNTSTVNLSTSSLSSSSKQNGSECSIAATRPRLGRKRSTIEW